MKISKEILAKSGLLPKLQLGIKQPGGGVKSTGKHRVKMIEDKIVKKPPREEGDDGFNVRYIVEEDGVKKQYDTRMKEKGGNDPSYFVQAMANVEPGEEVELTMKKIGAKNYIEIINITKGEKTSAESEDDADDSDGGKDDLVSSLEDIHKKDS